MTEEIADLVDENDRVVGRASRRAIRARKLLHRGVSIACVNGAGEIYVHRRTGTKDLWPGLHDMFVGGMVSSGETYEEAARRETTEELGIPDPRPRRLFEHRYRGADNPSWIGVFELVWDGPLAPSPEEIECGRHMGLDELAGALERRRFVPDGVEIFRRYLAARAGRAP